MTTPNHEFTASEGLELLLNDFRSKRTKLNFLRNYDEATEESRKNTTHKIEQLNEPVKSIASSLFKIQDEAFFLIQVILWKVDYLCEGLQHALKVKNPLSLANNARSLVEHIATLSTIGRELSKLEHNLKGQQSEKKIREALTKTEKLIHRAYYGQSSKGTKPKHHSIHINDSLNELKQEIGNIDEIYGTLCEYVHPNHGSNRLVSSGNIASGKLNPPEEFNRDILDQLRRICAYCLIYLNDQGLDHSNAPLRLQVLLDLCYVQGAKLNTVFAIKQANATGDGKSKETALYFKKARTATEAIEMTYTYFEDNGYKLKGSKSIGAMEGGYIYDVHSTNKGKVWVKIPTN